MRTTWMLAGISTGIMGLSVIAGASPNLDFETVINQGDSFAVGDAGDQFQNAGQVVVGPNGIIAMSAEIQNGGGSSPAVIYSTPLPSGGWSSQEIAVGDDTYNIPGIAPGEQFLDFNNVALTNSGTQLAFVAQDYSGNNGIIQWNTGVGLQDVAFEGDTRGYTSVGGDGTDSGGGGIEMQVNGSGQVLFPAIASGLSAGGLVRGNATPPPPLTPPPPPPTTVVFTNGTGSPPLTDTDPQSRVAVGSDNTSVALLETSSNVPGIYMIPASGGAATAIPLGNYTPFQTDPIMGYASGDGVNATLMLVNDINTGMHDIVVSKNGAAPHSILAHEFTIPNSISTPFEYPEGQMTPNGRIAVYVPSTTGDTIQYANAAPAGLPSATVVASVDAGAGSGLNSSMALDPTGTTLDIEALAEPGDDWGPEINSGGTILFNAEVGTSPSNEKQALLDWMPGDQSPEILLAAGDTVDIDGTPEIIDDFLLNALSNDYDYYKNALNDQNEVAVSVDYDDDTESAVLFAAISVPEPSTIALVSIASFSLMARRRRR
jgi:hypothetical protein